jgi:DNA-binding SARP family transcriptional activator
VSGGAGRVGRGLAALTGLALLVVGVPVGLTAAGQGPAIHTGRFGAGLLQPISDSTLVRLAELACWLVWLLFVLAVALEVLAALRAGAGRARARIRIPAFQGAASALVLSALLLLPQRGLPAGAVSRSSAYLPGAAMPTASALIVSTHPDRTAPVTRIARTQGAPAANAVRYVVQRYDSPWRIAERQLGDGTRWRELRDEHGRSLSIEAGAPDRGAGGQRPQARIIRPGEVLLLPAGARSIETEASTTAHLVEHPRAVEPAPPHHVVPVDVAPAAVRPAAPATNSQPSVTAAGLSTNSPAVPATSARAPTSGVEQPAISSAPSANVQTPTPTPAPVAPSTRAVVATPATHNSATSGVPEPPTPPSGRQPTDDQPPTIVEVAAERHARDALPTTLIEAGLLSAGVFATLQALRRRQAQHRPAGRRLRLPSRALARTESAVRLGAQVEQVEQIDRAVHHLVADLQRTQMAVPSVLAVVSGPTALEVLIGSPLPPPAPWTSSAEGFRWRITAAQLGPGQLVPDPTPSSAPLPGLVPVGKAGLDGLDVLLNLEAAGVLCVTGDAEKADAVVRALATNLSGLHWAQAVNLILVGFGSELDATANVRAVAALSSVIDELRSTALLLGDAIGDMETFAARVRRPDSDGWAPTIVCCTGTVDPAERAELLALATPGTGLVAVISGEAAPSAWTIDVDGQPMAVQPLRLAIDPTFLDADELKHIGELYTVALDDDGVTSHEPPYRDLDISADRPPRSLAERLAGVEVVSGVIEAARPGGPIIAQNGQSHGIRPPTHPITVSVLGTVEIDGAMVFKRAKSKELAVYLALHPNGVGEAELDEALWPSGTGRLVAPSTRDSTVSVARSALGGPTRLLPAQGQGREKRYQLSEDVGTDWSAFCQFHREGRAAQDTDLLAQALELVRGRPFDGVLSGRTYGWVHTEGHARHIEAEVADAADLAAELLLAKGQAIDARWAARRGLMADPYVERLWVRLMEGADQLGDSQEIERIMDEMDAVLDLQGDFSGLHPQTLAVYDRLSRRRRLPR